jgi:putative hydrolase of the HAD superfamily
MERRSLTKSERLSIKAVLFDYGGVLAEEGFREGLMAIGRANGLPEESFFQTAAQAVYDSGYVTGHSRESAYWDLLRNRTGISGTDQAFRKEILTRFILRQWMIEVVRQLRRRGLTVAILSDQTDWLDELNDRDDFFKEFDHVYNSFHVGKGKKDPSLFADVAEQLGLPGEEILFIDDNEGHVERARSLGLVGIVFRGKNELLGELESLFTGFSPESVVQVERMAPNARSIG